MKTQKVLAVQENKNKILNEVFELMERFISKKVSGEKFAKNYMVLWKEKIRSNNFFLNIEHEILDEMHSDCDCLNYPSKDIALSEEDLLKIVRDKITKLKEMKVRKK